MSGCRSFAGFCRRKMGAKQNIQIVLTIVGVAAGIGLGLGLRPAKLNEDRIRYLALPGDLFVRALRVLVMPVIASSIICGFSNLKSSLKGKLLLKAMIFYISTTILAGLTGVLLSLAIRPGEDITLDPHDSKLAFQKQKQTSASDAVYDLLMNLIPDNAVKATMFKYRTLRRPLFEEVLNLTESANASNFMKEQVVTVAKGELAQGTNYIGIIVMSIVVGSLLSSIGKEAQILVNLSTAIFKLTTRLIFLLMWAAPVGLSFLIAANILRVDNFEGVMAKLGKYILTVILGLFLHYFVTLSLIYFAIVRKNPYKFAAGMTQAVLTMIGTASSSATLPVTMRCVEENNKVDSRVTAFVLPIGATINMDGTCLYQALSAIFIAQLSGYETNFVSLITISLTATAASIGTAGVPMSSIVNILMVLQACNLPTRDWYLLLSVDWILGRLQGVVNILGDGIGAAVIAKLAHVELDKITDLERLSVNDGGCELLHVVKQEEECV